MLSDLIACGVKHRLHRQSWVSFSVSIGKSVVTDEMARKILEAIGVVLIKSKVGAK